MSRAEAAIAMFAALAVMAFPAWPSEAAIDKVRRKVLVQGKPCADPARPCTMAGTPFKPNELSFESPVKFAFDRGEDRSQPFYAAILKSAALCSLPEKERERIQALFPRSKVFLHRFFCDDFGDKVTYTNVDAKQGFIAVYAGETEATARAFLVPLLSSGRFPDASLRRMQVVIKWQIE